MAHALYTPSKKIENLKLFLGIFFTNLKSIIKRDRGNFRKHASNSKEIQYCKEYDINGLRRGK